jgi:hypothetical protein
MGTTLGRVAMLVGASVAIFAVTVMIGLHLVPEPRSETDYLVIGSAATFLSLAVLFVVLLTTWLRSPDVFFKRRPAHKPDEEPPTNPD